MAWMCLQAFLHIDPVICSELAFKISSSSMYEKIACDHTPHFSHFLLHICAEFLHRTQTDKVNYIYSRLFFALYPDL